jgi:hypothetical protein
MYTLSLHDALPIWKHMKNIKKYSLTALLGLALILCLGGCENPAGNDTNNTGNAAAAQKAADDFYAAHLEILEKPADLLTLDDEALVTAALEAYAGLKAGARALLAPEKARLDLLKAGVERLKIWAEQSAYYTAADLAAYLAGQPDNGPDDPYAVAYRGTETMITLYHALEAGGKYVGLDLSASGVTGFAAGAEEGRALIVSLVLPDSLAEIPAGTSTDYIFQGFTYLKEVRAADLTRLGGYTFTLCPSLATVILPEVTDIGQFAFQGCGSLYSIASSTDRLLSVMYPLKLETIGSSAFKDCGSLTNLPDAKNIGANAFQNCSGYVGNIILSNAVSIGGSAFNGCTGLTGVTVSNAEEIGASAFTGCRDLATVTLSKAETIGANAFQNCTSLATVSLPEAETIGNSAFSGCTSLTAVNLPKAESIGVSAYNGCTGLVTVTLPEASSIGNTAFNGCTSLVTVTLPEASSIGNSAFQACTSLATVILNYMPPTIGTTLFLNASTDTSRTITFKTPVSTFYTESPWSDKLGTSTDWATYWDTSANRTNLTVALVPPLVP